MRPPRPAVPMRWSYRAASAKRGSHRWPRTPVRRLTPHQGTRREQQSNESFLIVGSAFARTARAEEQLLAIGEGDVTAIGAVGTILRRVAFDHDHASGGERSLGEAAAQESVG